MNNPVQMNGNLKGLDIYSSQEEKVERIEQHFRAIFEALELDLETEGLRDTPKRLAKMYVYEMFTGLDPKNKPAISLFENDFSYRNMLVEKDICFHSVCEHHFLPIVGKAHVAYLPQNKIIGLSKINRLVNYCASRPQVQERLTVQILEEIQSVLEVEDVAILIEAIHFCVTARGIRDQSSSTITSKYSGVFLQEEKRNEFLDYIYKPAQKII